MVESVLCCVVVLVRWVREYWRLRWKLARDLFGWLPDFVVRDIELPPVDMNDVGVCNYSLGYLCQWGSIYQYKGT